MRVSDTTHCAICRAEADLRRIVEYATREQAQQAVQTLSNQNLMGRLVYVREVSTHPSLLCTQGNKMTLK